ncbi:MAG: 23S rRNA (guanosine(2251)-2'-O)-methyltransferase RlmB [Mycobacteriales bacterium]
MVSKKGPSKGTGGHGRRKLEGRGPTPKAEDRTKHPAARRARAAAKRAANEPRSPRSTTSARSRVTEDLVAGRNAVVEALRAAVPATTLHIAPGLDRDDRLIEAAKLATDHEIQIVETTRLQLDRITGGAPHQGIALAVRPYDYAHPDDLLARVLEGADPALFVALDSVTDPHNLGAVVRSAAAFGAHGVLLPERRSVGVTPSAWKASAGALARVPVARATNLVRTLTSYAQAGLMIAGLDGRGEIDLEALELASGPLVVVVGAEGKGLSRLVRETCDLTVRIPLAGPVESLNASVATGIALAEIARRRR